LRHDKTVSFAGSAASARQFPKGGVPEIAFLGRSNVGKSSLLNALAEVKGLARVSSTPGRTQLVNFFHVREGARPGLAKELLLVDLPGYGYAKVSEAVRRTWEKLVTSYLRQREELAVCVFLVDARHDPMPGDLALREFLERHGLPYVLVATKADKLGRGEQKRRLAALRAGFGQGAEAVTTVSALTRDGIDELWTTLRRAAAGSPLEDLPHV
jgi:GTP-binding protein